MFRFFFLLLLLTPFLNGEDKVEVYATSMDTKDNIVKADGEVIVIYQDYQLSAQSAIYDRNSGELELFGNIRASQGDSIKLLGDYAKLNISKKERTFKPFYMVEQNSDVWFSGSSSFARDKEVKIESGVLSGCDPNNPLWKMEFTSSDYNTDTKWLNIYNARIYIYDIPVFYTPYFGYSLDTTRRTGLLPPIFGFSAKEGFYYEQPLYIAEQNWWDLEFRPQTRTMRGSGIYSTFRFTDSKTSRGYLNMGYFKEKENYFLDVENKLANEAHYGFNFNYDNQDVIDQWLGTDLRGQSGLYADIQNMNDVDYMNLSTNDNTKNATTDQLLSRINVFYNTEKNYFGTYFTYYKDLTAQNNDRTLQNLPAIQYHSYLDTLFGDHLLYSLDVKNNNYHREIGISSAQTDLNLPITLQTSLFDEYMNVSYQSNIYVQHTKLQGKELIPPLNEYDSGTYARNYHMLSASSQQTRAYEELTHVVDIGVQYSVAGSSSMAGYYEEQKDYCSLAANKAEAICEFYKITESKENAQFYFSQYIFDDLGKQIIYHRLSQNITYDDGNNSGVGELENELSYQVTNSLNYYNNMFYNSDEQDFSKNFNQISYGTESIKMSLSHMYRNSFITSDTQYTSYMTSGINYRYSNHYSYNFRYDYDLEIKRRKSAEIGFLYAKRCWDFGVRYAENNRPAVNQSGVPGSIYERYIYFTIRLKPMMSETGISGFAYRLPDGAGEN